MSISIKASNLARRFADTVALDGVSFEIAAGELFGFIGPDGGGKTTLFRILVTLLKPDSGTATVLGLDVVRDLWAIRQRVGYMPGRFSLYPDLSVEENLRFFASVFDTTIEASYDQIAPIYEQIAPFKDRRAAALSGGMKQKLALCCALVHKPEVLFLDEPTTGVDAVSRREFWDLLGRLREGGLTIVVSTPYMDEANRCDRVALIQHGKLLAVDTPAAIASSFDRPLIGVHAAKRYDALLALRRFPHAHSVLPFGAVHHYTDERAGAPADQVVRELREFLQHEGIEADVTALQPTVEDTFIARMGVPPAGAAADLKVGLYDDEYDADADDRGGRPSSRPDADDRGGRPSSRPDADDRGSRPSSRPDADDRGSRPSNRPDADDRGGRPSSRPATPDDRRGRPSGRPPRSGHA